MNRFIIIIFSLIIITSSGLAQDNNRQIPKSKDFKYPVLVKLISGSSNIFRIGFIRYSDFWEVKEDLGELTSFYARFLNDNELKNKLFVYFPISEKQGDMMIIDKTDIQKLDMTKEQAMEIILPD